jgi:hypothetical protein
MRNSDRPELVRQFLAAVTADRIEAADHIPPEQRWKLGPCLRVSMMKWVVLAGSAVRTATSGVETQRAAWNADANSSIDRIMYVLLSRMDF